MAKFLFFVHGRHSLSHDLSLTMPDIKLVEDDYLVPFCCALPPQLFPVTDKITGQIKGWLCFLLLPGRLKSIRENMTKMIDGIKMAKAMCGNEHLVVGLGALTAPATRQGEDLIPLLREAGIDDVSITNGNSLTAAITVESVKELAKRQGIPIEESVIAIVGAGGSVGNAVSEIFAPTVKRLILVSRPGKEDEMKNTSLAWTRQMLEQKITFTGDISDIKEADIVIVTSSAETAIVKACHLKEGSIVYDDTQPRNTDVDEILLTRKDVLLVDGGLVATPRYSYSMDIGLPNGYAYACFTETMMLSLLDAKTSFIGRIRANNASDMLNLFLQSSEFFHLPEKFFCNGKEIK